MGGILGLAVGNRRHIGEFDRRVVEEGFREIVHRVTALRGDEDVGEHGVEERAGHFDAVVVQNG